VRICWIINSSVFFGGGEMYQCLFRTFLFTPQLTSCIVFVFVILYFGLLLINLIWFDLNFAADCPIMLEFDSWFYGLAEPAALWAQNDCRDGTASLSATFWLRQFQEMSTSAFFIFLWLNPTGPDKCLTRPDGTADHKQNTDPTQPHQLMMTPEV